MASSTGAGQAGSLCPPARTPTPRPAGISSRRPLTSVSVQTQASRELLCLPAAPTFFHRHSSPNPSVSPALHRRALLSMVSRPWPSWRQVHHSGHMPSLTSAPREQVLWALRHRLSLRRGPARPSGSPPPAGVLPTTRWGSQPTICPVATKWGWLGMPGENEKCQSTPISPLFYSAEEVLGLQRCRWSPVPPRPPGAWRGRPTLLCLRAAFLTLRRDDCYDDCFPGRPW